MDSLAELLSSLDSSTVLLFVVFLVSFSILFFALMKTFKKNTAIAGIIAGALSFLIVYGMSTMDWDWDNIFSDIGLSEDVLGIAIPIVILVAMIFIIVKLAKNSLLIFGSILILIGAILLEGSSRWILVAIGGLLMAIRFLFFPEGRWEMRRKESKD